MSTSPPWRYRVLLRSISPLIVVYTLWRSIKDGGIRYLLQRLGLSFPLSAEPGNQLNPQRRYWIHAASVGEVITALPLIKALCQSGIDHLLVTTNTPTGAAVLAQHKLAGVQHCYLPWDFPGACARFLDRLQPAEAWILETELWPWLFAQCQRRDIAITIVNGRLSERTSRQATGLLSSSYRHALRSIRVLARSDKDRNRFIALGSPPHSVQVLGNLKYADNRLAGQKPAGQAALIQSPYWLAASTHEDEEVQLAKAWLKSYQQGLLVIVPRHPERGPAIARQLQPVGGKPGLRSKGEYPEAGQRLYIADTLGELPVWYAHCTAAFIGGSLIERGGHNMLEAARWAKPIVVGPHTDNFDDIVRDLAAADAIEIAEHADAAVEFLLKAGQSGKPLSAMGQRAQAVAVASSVVLQSYVDSLLDRTQSAD